MNGQLDLIREELNEKAKNRLQTRKTRSKKSLDDFNSVMQGSLRCINENNRLSEHIVYIVDEIIELLRDHGLLYDEGVCIGCEAVEYEDDINCSSCPAGFDFESEDCISPYTPRFILETCVSEAVAMMIKLNILIQIPENR